MPSPPHPWLSFDVAQARELATSFLAEEVEHAEADGVVVGISGGLDSATTVALAAEALDPDTVDAVFLPGPTSPDEDEDLARQVADSAGVEMDRVPIAPGLEALEPELGVELDSGTKGNLQARLRMCVLYARANARGSLVLGTGNKSELLTGYFTKHGDGAADLLPLGDLYKTQTRVLAERLGVPEAVRQRAPTAGLWEGQRDEDELGLAYAELDVVLAGLAAGREEDVIAAEAGIAAGEVERVASMVAASEHKRALPPIPELRGETPDVDRQAARG